MVFIQYIDSENFKFVFDNKSLYRGRLFSQKAYKILYDMWYTRKLIYYPANES